MTSAPPLYNVYFNVDNNYGDTKIVIILIFLNHITIYTNILCKNKAETAEVI